MCVFLKEGQQQEGGGNSSLCWGVLHPISTFHCVPRVGLVIAGHSISWERMALVNGKCRTQEGQWPSWWVGCLWQVCSVLGTTFPKQNILILGQNISDFGFIFFFYISMFVQKKQVFFDRLVLGLEGLKVWSVQQICTSDQWCRGNVLDQQINTSEVFLHFCSSYVHLFVSAYGRRGVDI